MTETASGSPKSNDVEEEVLDLCPQCQKKYSKTSDVITLNPSAEEEERLREDLQRRRLLEPPKKSKKRKNVPEGDEPLKKKRGTVDRPITNSSVASSKAFTSELALEEARRKATMSDAVKSLYGEGGPRKKETFMTMGTFTRVSFSFSLNLCDTDLCISSTLDTPCNFCMFCNILAGNLEHE